jgi:multimeric flavodoxin WrbA
MVVKEKKILGVSGSPRKNGNVDELLRVALDEAAKAENIATEIVYLRDYRIQPCNSCFACCTPAAAGKEFPCLSFNDDMNLLYPKLGACDGLILGSPVFFGTVTAQMKAFMDRTEGLLRYSQSKWKYSLNNKVGAGLTVGGNRNGGQEFTLLTIHYFFLVHNMILVGTGPEPTPGCYLGGCGTTFPQKGPVKGAVLKDELGVKSARMVGRRVAEVLALMK